VQRSFGRRVIAITDARGQATHIQFARTSADAEGRAFAEEAPTEHLGRTPLIERVLVGETPLDPGRGDTVKEVGMSLRAAGSRRLLLGVIALGGLLALAACGDNGSDETVGTLEQEARYWQQLTSLLEPVDMPSMSDHRAFMLPTGGVIALHFDNMDLDEAENLNWVALGVPGTFCSDDQERVTAQFGEGFTHFHDMVNDIHGGQPGAEGVWFVHVAVRDFEAPWGGVSQGIDHNFMPTAAPDCA
jgi:hypothetical protein